MSSIEGIADIIYIIPTKLRPMIPTIFIYNNTSSLHGEVGGVFMCGN